MKSLQFFFEKLTHFLVMCAVTYLFKYLQKFLFKEIFARKMFVIFGNFWQIRKTFISQNKEIASFMKIPHVKKF